MSCMYCSWKISIFKYCMLYIFLYDDNVKWLSTRIKVFMTEDLAWWSCGLRYCHWLLAVSHNCPGPYRGRAYEKITSNLVSVFLPGTEQFSPPATTGW